MHENSELSILWILYVVQYGYINMAVVGPIPGMCTMPLVSSHQLVYDSTLFMNNGAQNLD